MNNKKIMIAVKVFFAVCATLLAVYYITSEKPDEGRKNITVTVTYKDGTSKEYPVKTDKNYLSDVLVELGLVSEETKSFFDTVDGIKADYNADQSYWMILKDGETAVVGANEIAVTDGSKYELRYTIFTME